MTTRSLQIVIDQIGDASPGIESIISKLDSAMPSAADVAKFAITGVGVAIAGVTAAAAGLGALATSAFYELDGAVDALMASTGETGTSLDAMADSVLRISENSAGVGQSMTDIGETMAEVRVRTGLTGDALEEVTESMLTLSRLTDGDAVKSTELITRVMGDWGLEMEDTALVTDKLFKASQTFGIGVDDLAAKVVQFGAPLRQMGFTFEESITLFGKWEQEGVNAELVMGSLRIAAGHFAKAQGEANTVTVGTIKNMGEAEEKLAKMKDQLNLMTIKQSEWTDKTKESTKAQWQLNYDELTKDIYELEYAMSQGEQRTIQVEGAQKTLRDSLLETFDAIKNNTDGTAALGLAMEVFGARAGPDMAAAIREGRFSIEEYIDLFENVEGTLEDTGDATLDFADKFPMLKQQVLNSLIPIGASIENLAMGAFPLLEEGASRISSFFTDVAGPAFESFAGSIIAALPTREQFGAAIDSGITSIQESLAKLDFSPIAEAWEDAKPSLDIAGAALRDIGISLGIISGSEAGEGLAKVGLSAEEMNEPLLSANTLIGAAAWILKEAAQGAEDVSTGIQGDIDTFETWKDRYEGEWEAALTSFAESWDRITDALGLTTDALNTNRDAIDKDKQPIDLLKLGLDGVSLVTLAVSQRFDELSRVISIGADWFNTVTGKISDFIGKLGDLEPALPGWMRPSGSGSSSGLSRALSGISDAISRVVDKFRDMARSAREAASAIPSWMRPGSPAPLEIAMLGIANATQRVNEHLSKFGAIDPQGGLAIMEGLRGADIAPVEARRLPRRLEQWAGNTAFSRNYEVVVNYQPLLSTVNPREIQDILQPIIMDALRNIGITAPAETR